MEETKREGDGTMHTITVNLKSYQINILDAMKADGLIVNRSEAIRVALDGFIRDTLVMLAIERGITSGKTLMESVKMNPPKTKFDLRSQATFDRIRKMFARHDDDGGDGWNDAPPGDEVPAPETSSLKKHDDPR